MIDLERPSTLAFGPTNERRRELPRECAFTASTSASEPALSYRLFSLLLALALGADSFAGAALDATFSSRGAQLDVDGTEVSMFVAAIGRDGAPIRLDRGTPEIDGAEVRTSIAAGVVEWWRQLAAGLEHGVTIDVRPPGDGALRVEVQASGLSPRLRTDDEIEFVHDGEVRMTYAHLVTLDADGARVPSHMEVANGRVVLSIDDDHARYPLVIDPLLVVEEATLRAPTAVFNDRLGESIGITADGTRVITSGITSRVFRRSGTSWTLEATLVGGTTVAISPDGTRAIVATNLATRFFVRAGTSWTMEANLGALDVVGAALDLDGSRAVIARSSSYELYARSGASWTRESSGAGGTTVVAVAITRDGSRAFIGQPDENTSRGLVLELVRTGTTWAAGQTLTSATNAAYDNFGESLAISADGTRLAVGATERNGLTPGAGFAEVFVRSTTWARESVLNAIGGGASRDYMGSGVGISSDGRMIVVGAPGVGADRGRILAFGRTGSSWSQDQSFTPAGLSDDDDFGTSVAMADAERVVVGSPGDRIGTTTNAGTAYVLRIGGAPGTSCGGDAECAGGFCTDGVCCGSRCDGNCESCSAAGACVPAPSTTVCRASAGLCDPVAERCDGTSGTCPADARAAAGTTCRAVAGTCDVAETCDGSSAACPADTRVAADTECRAASGLCDRPEVCDGSSPACPAPGASGALASGTTCREPTGVCDLREVCDGTSPTCPGDVFLSAGTSCGGMPGTCVSVGTCNGTSGGCLGSAMLPSGAVCLAASLANPCDIDDLCDGSSTVCVPRFATADTVCNDLLTGVCDAPDLCTGTSADCAPTFLSGTECRAASAPCDNAEVCSGSSPVCPPDTVEAAGMSCRVSVDSTCDPVEVCDGVAASCPADENTCVDAGAIDGGLADAATDAGPPVVASGCGCRAGRSGPSGLWILGIAVLVLRRKRG